MTQPSSIKVLINHRAFKFLSVGVLNTIVGYALYAILIFANVPYLAALFLATVAGVIFNYYSFGRLVFNSMRGKYVFSKFIISYTLIYISNACLLYALTKIFMINAYAGQIICIPLSVALSWTLMNKWVYKQDICDAR